MSTFKILRRWLPQRGASEIDVTMAQLQISVDGKNVTEFVEEYGGNESDHLEIPVYFVAE
jgi:hypothetical protein